MKSINNSFIAFLTILAVLFTAVAPVANAAYPSVKLADDVYNDFVVGPGKVQLDMKPGETRTTTINVTNRLGSNKEFKIELEDIAGTRDPQQTVVLLENDRGPHSLKDFLDIPEKVFNINHGERVTIPVTVRVPADAEPGGMYGSVVISTVTPKAENSTAGVGSSPVITRIGVLFFIRVPGEVKEDGKLTEFSLKDSSFRLSNGPMTFRMLYENNGNIHENPYGVITVKNMLGSNVGTVPIEPWFALPDSLRQREVVWNPPFLFGRYTATAEINRGYGNIVDTMKVSFWVIPWKPVVIIIVGLFLIIFIFRWFVSRFSFVRRR